MSFNYSELQQQLVERESNNLLRSRSTISSPQGAVVTVDNCSYLNFCSNDYLGFANHAALNAAVKNTVDESGTGGGASHLICG
ncbi:MAG: 8-amino-7-oxononanoate synthase, partial [Sinobacterium sp.]|nr:8-amino-7-oxononanoate synthase [Sinobacterium sp.]